jgi:uncharacterized protein (TIGR03067 family)
MSTPLSRHRQWPLLLAVVIVTICQAINVYAATKSDSTRLTGQWELVRWERSGVAGPRQIGIEYEFFADGTYQISPSEGNVSSKQKYRLNETVVPKQMDWFVTLRMADMTVKEVNVQAIYEIEGETLRICKPMKLDGFRPAAFDSKPDNDLLIFRRITPARASEMEKGRREAARVAAKTAAFQRLGAAIYSGKLCGQLIVDFQYQPWMRTVRREQWQDLLDLGDIRSLVLHGCTGVGDNEMQYVGKLIALESLDLHSTEVGNAGVAELSGLSNLERLDLSFTSINDAGLAAVAKMGKLKKIIVKGTMVTEDGIEGLRAMQKDLEIIWPRAYTESQQQIAAIVSRLGLGIDDDRDRYLQSGTPTCQIMIPSYTCVRDRAVGSGDRVKPRVPSDYVKKLDASVVADYLGKLPGPTSVDVADVGMDDSIFSCIHGIHGLVRLSLRSTHITDAGLAKVQQHKSLKALDLSYSKSVTDKGVSGLASLAKLERLDLSGVKLTPTGVAPLLALGHLKMLTLDRNALNDDLIWQFRQKGVQVRLR